MLTGLLAVAAGACSSAPRTTPAGSVGQPTAAPTTAALTEEVVSVGAALALMRGHHIAARELFASGDASGALAHATHPVAEILDSVRGDIDAKNGDAAALGVALQLVISAAQGDSEAALGTAIDGAAVVMDAAEQAVAGSLVSDTAYAGSVIAATLDTAGHEYAEAVTESGIGELIEYQDAYAFTRQAAADYAEIAAPIGAGHPAEAAEIDEAFEVLGVALPGVQPPATIAAVEDVEAAAELIAHELEEVVGALPVSESDPAAEQAAIEGLLDEISELVAGGDRVQAAEVAAEAYLDHYEVIEAAVIAAAPDINDELEPLLGAGLRQQINAGATVEEIDGTIARVKALLGQAIEALE
ncbi:MAG TPA: hypothetical protein VMZ33_05040, partial [Candidatus Limnocylindrales bacterium]|nr:hypothetical protein [Candidatus Limnocylindrales bacterium]